MASPPKTEALKQAVLRLKPKARSNLLRDVVQSLWAEESLRRDSELDSGKVKEIPGEAVFARIRSRHKR